MITISHKYLDEPLNLDRSYLHSLIFENQRYYRNFLSKLEGQILNEDEFLFVCEGQKNLALSKVGALIKTPLFWEPDEKKITTTIQKDIIAGIDEEDKFRYEQIKQELIDWLDDIVVDYRLPVDFDREVDAAAILKAFSVAAAPVERDYCGWFIGQIKKIAFTLKKRLFFVMNLHDFFEEEELKTIFHELSLCEIDIVILSGHLPKSLSSVERVILVDKDLAELHLNG